MPTPLSRGTRPHQAGAYGVVRHRLNAFAHPLDAAKPVINGCYFEHLRGIDVAAAAAGE